jgi:hypothetical protein
LFVGKSANFKDKVRYGVKPSGSSEASDITLPRKASKLILIVPVLITNTGAQGEYPKASEITNVKELGKITP